MLLYLVLSSTGRTCSQLLEAKHCNPLQEETENSGKYSSPLELPIPCISALTVILKAIMG